MNPKLEDKKNEENNEKVSETSINQSVKDDHHQERKTEQTEITNQETGVSDFQPTQSTTTSNSLLNTI